MKKLITVILVFTICLNVSGCGKIDRDSDRKVSSAEIQSQTATPHTDIKAQNSPDNETQDNVEPNKEDVTQESLAGSYVANETPEPTETPKIEKVKFTSDEAYLDSNRRVKFLGLKEYKEIAGDYHTDKPQKGNKYLVLFLSIANMGNEKDYINYNYLSVKVDGKKTDHTFLVNSPRNYPPIFEHIEAGKTIGGFIVWEVPSNWKSLSLTYDGWKDTDNISLSGKFTRKDLQNPIIYDSSAYN